MAVPHIIDQFIWGQKLAELGVGPVPIPRTRLTVENMRHALVELTHNSDYRENSKRIGDKIKQEKGVEKAVQLIEQSLNPIV